MVKIWTVAKVWQIPFVAPKRMNAQHFVVVLS
jgi:hypothetical protein